MSGFATWCPRCDSMMVYSDLLNRGSCENTDCKYHDASFYKDLDEATTVATKEGRFHEEVWYDEHGNEYVMLIESES